MVKKIEQKEEVLVHRIEKVKEERSKIPIEEQKKIHKRMFTNLVIATVIILYFIFIILGYMNIAREAFLVDLRVFSLGILIGAIVLFEKSYKKDDDILALYGIETLAVAIVTLVAIYVCILFETKFVMLISIVSYAFAIYYIAKACVISKRMTNAYIESQNDIKEIVKKEKPEKVVETKKKENKIKKEENEGKAKKSENEKTIKTIAKKKSATSKKTTTQSKEGKTGRKQTTRKTSLKPKTVQLGEDTKKKETKTTKPTATKKTNTTTKKQTTKKKVEAKKEE